MKAILFDSREPLGGRNILQYYFDLGIQGPDLIWAGLGPQKGTHPPGAEASALEHLLGGAKTILPDRGLFLNVTRRLHPNICRFTSEIFYEGRLRSLPGLERQRIDGHELVNGSGLWFAPLFHEGNQSSSVEEAEMVARLARSLVEGDVRWTNANGETARLSWNDILVVAPYNAQVNQIAEQIPQARVGTVDRFQGQQAPVVIYSVTTSSPEEAPRGMEFLYSLNRLNVATSRAQAACILVACPRILQPECATPRQMQLANAFCRYLELSTVTDWVEPELRRSPLSRPQTIRQSCLSGAAAWSW